MLINLGSSNRIIFIGSYIASQKSGLPPIQNAKRTNGIESGDQEFIRSASVELVSLAKAIIEAIRSVYAGELRFYPKAKRFVESPDNFLAICAQPRKKNFAIYVRGLPHVFQAVIETIEPRRDRAGYSRFTLGQFDQIPELMAILNLVRKKVA